jgi:tRNA(fMet)-specific endonuclease VapC
VTLHELFDQNTAKPYGLIRHHLKSLGTPIGPLDFLIAAHALALNSILITNNTKEFNRVPNLSVEDWSI